MSNSKTEDFAILHVLELERAAGRDPVDLRRAGSPYDISSPPRRIEVKAFGGSARGAGVPLEEGQVAAARANPDQFFLYVVDNVARALAGEGEMCVLIVPGDAVLTMVERTKPSITYWPTLRVAEYDQAQRLS